MVDCGDPSLWPKKQFPTEHRDAAERAAERDDAFFTRRGFLGARLSPTLPPAQRYSPHHADPQPLLLRSHDTVESSFGHVAGVAARTLSCHILMLDRLHRRKGDLNHLARRLDPATPQWCPTQRARLHHVLDGLGRRQPPRPYAFSRRLRPWAGFGPVPGAGLSPDIPRPLRPLSFCSSALICTCKAPISVCCLRMSAITSSRLALNNSFSVRVHAQITMSEMDLTDEDKTTDLGNGQFTPSTASGCRFASIPPSRARRRLAP